MAKRDGELWRGLLADSHGSAQMRVFREDDELIVQELYEGEWCGCSDDDLREQALTQTVFALQDKLESH